MISSKHWRQAWNPQVPGFEGVYRVILLRDMWALYDWSTRIANRASLVPTELMLNVIQHGVLNRSQVAILARRTRQAIAYWCADRDLDRYFEMTAAAGPFDPDQLNYLIHMTNKLSNQEDITSKEVAALHQCGSLTLMHALVGAPVGTIRRAMKGLPV